MSKAVIVHGLTVGYHAMRPVREHQLLLGQVLILENHLTLLEELVWVEVLPGEVNALLRLASKSVLKDTQQDHDCNANWIERDEQVQSNCGDGHKQQRHEPDEQSCRCTFVQATNGHCLGQIRKINMTPRLKDQTMDPDDSKDRKVRNLSLQDQQQVSGCC